MHRFSLIIVLAATFLIFAVLYGVQPLLPRISAVFGVSATASATLIMWSMLAMSAAPLVLGLVMQRIPPRRLIAWSMVGLGLTEMGLFYVSWFPGLQAVRLIQGALVATVAASVMTYIALTAHNLRQVMAYFVSVSVVGGLIGRIVSGAIATHWVWEGGFLFWGLIAFLCGIGAFRLAPEPDQPTQTSGWHRLFGVLRNRRFVQLYGVIFAAFFVFTAFVNFLPFRLRQLDPHLSETVLALAYTGFVMGMTTSLFAPRIADRLGGSLRAMMLGLSLLALGLLLTWGDATALVFASVFPASGGLFLCHAVLSGYLNSLAGSKASSVNSLYVSIYYGSGALGAFVPGLVFASFGWTMFLLLLFGFITSGLLLIWSSRRTPVTALT